MKHRYTGPLLALLLVLLGIERTAAQEPNSPPPPPERAALSDSAYFDDYYNWIWDNYLYTQPDTAFELAETMHNNALGPGQELYAAKALDLQGITWYVRGQPLKAAEYSTRTLPIYEALNDRQTLASTLGNTGAFLMRGSLYDSALVVLQRALTIQTELHDTLGISNTYNSIGNVHLERGDLHRSLDAYRSALLAGEAIADSASIANAEGNLGTIYAKQKEFKKALFHFEKASAILRSRKEYHNLVIGLLNIGGVHSELNDTTLALANLREGFALAKDLGDERNMAAALISIGELYGKAGQHERALATFQEGLRYTEVSQDPWARSQLFMNVGSALLELGNLKEAAKSGEEALALARREGIITPMRDAAELLAKVYQREGKYEQALEAHLLFTQLRDSLNNEENERAVIGFDLRRNYEQHALTDSLQHVSETAIQQKEIQKQKVIRNGFMGGFALVALFAGVIFFQRNKISKEKARSEELLLNILPEEVAEELKAKGSAAAVQIDQVTVLFTDFKGFTAMSEILTPKELVRDLHECFSAFDHICEKHGLEKIKTIGDAYMAAGGLPTPNTTHATDVINAALEIRDFISQGKVLKIANGLPYFEIRIGIHTGPVVAGIVGVKKFSYDIWGDTVNTASRMESSGEVGHVNISEATYDLVQAGPGLHFTPRGKVQAKGKGDMEMYFVEKA